MAPARNGWCSPPRACPKPWAAPRRPGAMRHPILATLAVVLVAACSAGASSSPPTPTGPPAAGPGAIAGRTFWYTAVKGHDLVPDTRVRLVFNPDGTLGATAGCNSMGGTWSLDGTTLLARIGQMTEMGCTDDRFAQDDWLSKWLAAELSATIGGDELVLEGSGVTMTLLDREVADPDQPLEGTTWVLDGIELGGGADGAVSSVPAGVHATIRLDAGQLAVDAGCNTGSATATVDGETLTVGPLALTKRACQQDATNVEGSITQILKGQLSVAVDGATLRLTGPTGGLTFRAE